MIFSVELTLFYYHCFPCFVLCHTVTHVLLFFFRPFTEASSITDQAFMGLNGKTKKESDRDRMVRLGFMTPFGTIVKAAEKSPPPAPSTDFEKFLMSAPGKGGKKKPTKRASLSGSSRNGSAKTQLQDSAPRQSSRNGSAKTQLQDSTPRQSSQGRPSLLANKRSNLFDEKDFRNYDPEVDYTQKRFQRKRRYKMAHNFSEDAQLSGDEYQDEDGEIVESDGDYVPDRRDMRHMSELDTEDGDCSGRKSCVIVLQFLNTVYCK